MILGFALLVALGGGGFAWEKSRQRERWTTLQREVSEALSTALREANVRYEGLSVGGSVGGELTCLIDGAEKVYREGDSERTRPLTGELRFEKTSDGWSVRGTEGLKQIVITKRGDGLLSGAAANGVQLETDPATAEELSQVAAWMTTMDDGNYGRAWDEAAESFRAAVTRADWITRADQIRLPLGVVTSREIVSTRRLTELPGMPDGNYLQLEYRTAFANLGEATETVAVMRSNDESWKTISYKIVPRSGKMGGEATAAERAGQGWLKEVDAGKYAESWKSAAEFFRARVTEEQWVEMMNAFRAPLGALESRRIRAVELRSEVAGLPKGRYAVMQFDASFANKQAAIETLSLELGEDGQWRAVGYFIR